MATSKTSQTKTPVGKQKPRKPSKRALETEPVDDDAGNQDQNNFPRPPVRKRRSERSTSSSSSCDIQASPSAVDAKVSSSDVSHGLSKPKKKPGPKPGFKYPTEAES